MGCLITFNDNVTTGVLLNSVTTNGLFELLGYSTTEGGTYGAGGNWPNATQAWDDSEDTSAIIPGFYKFKYKSALDPGNACYGEMEIIVPIVQGATDVGDDVAIGLCSGDAVRNIFDDSGLYDIASVNPAIVTIGGAGISSPGYAAGGAGVVTDDTYDPSLEVAYPAVAVFEITFTPQAPAGYTLLGCDNCTPDTVSITYTTTATFDGGTVTNIAVCNDGDV